MKCADIWSVKGTFVLYLSSSLSISLSAALKQTAQDEAGSQRVKQCHFFCLNSAGLLSLYCLLKTDSRCACKMQTPLACSNCYNCMKRHTVFIHSCMNVSLISFKFVYSPLDVCVSASDIVSICWSFHHQTKQRGKSYKKQSRAHLEGHLQLKTYTTANVSLSKEVVRMSRKGALSSVSLFPKPLFSHSLLLNMQIHKRMRLLVALLQKIGQ